MVETIRLESGHTLTGIVGSNPSLSASSFYEMRAIICVGGCRRHLHLTLRRFQIPFAKHAPRCPRIGDSSIPRTLPIHADSAVHEKLQPGSRCQRLARACGRPIVRTVARSRFTACADLLQRRIVFSSTGRRVRGRYVSLFGQHPFNLPQVIHVMSRKHPHNMLHRFLSALRMHPVMLPLLRRQ